MWRSRGVFIWGCGVWATPLPHQRSRRLQSCTVGSNRPPNHHSINGSRFPTCDECVGCRWQQTAIGWPTCSVRLTPSSHKWAHPSLLEVWPCRWGEVDVWILLGILNIITKNRLSSLNLVTVPKMPNLSLTPLKPSCHSQHDIRDAVLKYAIALLNK